MNIKHMDCHGLLYYPDGELPKFVKIAEAGFWPSRFFLNNFLTCGSYVPIFCDILANFIWHRKKKKCFQNFLNFRPGRGHIRGRSKNNRVVRGAVNTPRVTFYELKLVHKGPTILDQRNIPPFKEIFPLLRKYSSFPIPCSLD